MSTYQIDLEPSEEGFLVVTLSGRAEADTILRLLDKLNTLAQEKAPLRVLIDESGLRAAFVGPGDIRRIVAAWRRAAALRTTRIAVFTSNLAIYGLNRMFQGLVAGDAEAEVSVFEDRARAAAWLLEG